MDSRERSAWLLILLGACLYAMASTLRHSLLPGSGLASEGLLFLIVLSPGVLVGYFRPRRVLEMGFVAGVVADAAYQLGSLFHEALIHSAVASVPTAAYTDSLLHALPAGILSAAGGAVGYVLRVRQAGATSTNSDLRADGD
jgi:hypothetical protein